MVLAFVLAALLHCRPVDVAEDEVDLVELNHFYGGEWGEHTFDQIIFYTWCPRLARYQVRAYRLVGNATRPPLRDWAGGGYVMLWHDGELTRKIRTRCMQETWTQHDPEMRERDCLPKKQRWPLFTPYMGAKQGEGSD